MRIKKYEKKVSSILMNKPKARDCDYILYAFLLLNYNIDISILSAKDFLKQMSERSLPSFEGVGRCRRKLQEKHKELRGTKWLARHDEVNKVKTEIKTM
jgi:hypothetical protein|tara:strand:+ start:556 stop:852 length:297 start_codon:yes stop_codon:yes gene_type:complete